MTDQVVVASEDKIKQIVKFLTNRFDQASSYLGRAARSSDGVANEAYKAQTEFAYLLNEIVQGPNCMVQKNISLCNECIERHMHAAMAARQ